MDLFSSEDFDERYLADMLDPMDSTYMLSELAATISNKINEAIAVMTHQPLKKEDLTDGKRFLPRFSAEKQKADPDSVKRFQRAAASMFGGG